jgi:Glycine zipper
MFWHAQTTGRIFAHSHSTFLALAVKNVPLTVRHFLKLPNARTIWLYEGTVCVLLPDDSPNRLIKGEPMNFEKLFGTLVIAIVLITAMSGCSGGPLSTREKGAGIGALGGAAAGGLIGAAVGHPGAGAAIGGALGLGAGALIGDQLQGQERTQSQQQQQLEENQAEIQRQRQQIDQLKRRQEY